ncbi:MAG: hypothetical protein AABX93_01360 [Nanoarchaeota archaeon]
MKLEKLPSVISNNQFDDNGLVISGDKRLVPAYMASQLGFNVPGKRFLEYFYKRLEEEAGVLPLCPFTSCEEYLDFKKLENCKTLEEYKNFWKGFKSIIGPVNYETLIPKSKMLIAILDGGHSSDDGTSAEIGHYATKYEEKPIIGIRSDFRLTENIEAPINMAVSYFLGEGPNKGYLFLGPNAYEDAIGRTKTLADKIRANS